MSSSSNQHDLCIGNVSDAVFIRLLALFAIGVTLLIYGCEIANYSLSIDEEIARYTPGTWRTWIAQGRWAMGALVYLLPEGLSSIPFLPTLVFAIGLAASAVIFSTVFTQSRREAIAFTGVFAASPVFLHIGEFNTLSWGFSIGLVATALATKHFNKGGTRNSVIAGAYVGASMAIYQALVILYVTAILLLCIKKDWGSATTRRDGLIRRNIPIFGSVMKSLLVSLITYVSMDRLFKSLSGAETDYLDNWVGFSAYAGEGRAEALLKVWDKVKGLLFGTDPTFAGVGIASLLLVWFGCLFVVRMQFDGDVSVRSKVYAIVLSLAALFASVSLIVLSAGSIPTRALVSFPLLYAALSALVFRCKRGQRLQWTLFVAALFADTYIANSLFYADHIVRQRDLVMATRMIDRIEDVGRSSFGHAIPIAVFGEWEHENDGPALRVEIFGDSFFGHDGGNSHRIAAYFRLLGCQGLIPLKLNQLTNELDEIRLHPSWPAKESVFRTERAVIVKLSDLSYQQGLELQHK